MARPTVSILIPIWRLQPTLFGECLASIAAQTYDASVIETVVCFDGTPATEVHAARAGLVSSGLRHRTVAFTEQRGMAAARNACADVATGEWLLPLDHDDALTTDAVEQLVTLAEPGIDLVYSDYEQIGGSRESLFRSNCAAYHTLLLDRGVGWDSPIIHSTFILQAQLVRAVAFQRIGGFSPRVGLGHEVDFRVRLWSGSNFAYLPRVLYLYVWRPDSTYHTRYAELVTDTCMVLLAHARHYLPTVTGCCRLGKVGPFQVTHYGFLDATCQRHVPDWVNYDDMRLRE